MFNKPTTTTSLYHLQTGVFHLFPDERLSHYHPVYLLLVQHFMQAAASSLVRQNGFTVGKTEQANDLFTITTIFLGMHEDAQRVQCSTHGQVAKQS